MKRYVIRRLLMAIPLLLAISFVCFVFINIIPSNPAEVALRVQQMPVITEEAIAEMEEMLGLNNPFMIRYFNWVLGCLQGDFGISYVNPARTVAGELARCLPATLQLAAASFVIVLVLSIPIGFLCAVYKDRWFDKLMRGLVFVTTAMPAYWVGLLLMWLISVKLGLLPTNGSGTLRHLILPAFTVALSYISTYIRLILFRHLLPSITSDLAVLASLDVGWAIINISTLSFLGLGVQAPTPEWGAMLNEAKEVLTSNPTQMIAPGIAIVALVCCFNLMGDALRDVLDPKEVDR